MTTFLLDPTVHIVASEPRPRRHNKRRQYRDKQFKGDDNDWKKRLDRSTTVYVGNLSAYTHEYQLHELFSRCGSIRRIIMGLDKFKKTPCGFCFIEYDERASALKSIKYLSRIPLDGRPVQVDIDAGFEEGRQFGRGASGGQIGDERQKEREQVLAQQGQRHGQPGGASGILTRSITVVACLTMISLLLLAAAPEMASADIIIRPYNLFSPPQHLDRGRYISLVNVRQAQLSEQRTQFERNFAQFLVNLMKSAKPTLMKAFIQATLADKQLKEIAIALFFNNTDTDNGDGDGSR